MGVRALVYRTIHGLVYNAMKFFMDIDEHLFNECSRRYNEMQDTADQRERARQGRWDMLAKQASRARANSCISSPRSGGGTTPTKRPSASPAARSEEVDPITHDSQQRLDALRLQDEAAAPKEFWDGSERRLRDHERSHSSQTRSHR